MLQKTEPNYQKSLTVPARSYPRIIPATPALDGYKKPYKVA